MKVKKNNLMSRRRHEGAEEKSTGLETAGQSAVSKTADIKSEKSVDPYLVNKSRTSGPAAATRSNARPVVAFFPSDFTSQKVWRSATVVEYRVFLFFFTWAGLEH